MRRHRPGLFLILPGCLRSACVPPTRPKLQSTRSRRRERKASSHYAVVAERPHARAGLVPAYVRADSVETQAEEVAAVRARTRPTTSVRAGRIHTRAHAARLDLARRLEVLRRRRAPISLE